MCKEELCIGRKVKVGFGSFAHWSTIDGYFDRIRNDEGDHYKSACS